MAPLTLLYLALVAVAAAFPADQDLPHPSELVHTLTEDQFEDYLDLWLSIEEPKWLNETTSVKNGGCALRVNGDLGQPQPVYLRNGNYLEPTGNSGLINFRSGERVTIACTGSGRTIRHPNIVSSVSTAEATCVNGDLFSGTRWLSREGAFRSFTCSSHSYHDSEETSEKCYNGNTLIRTGFYVNGVFYPVYYSCFDKNRLEVLYVFYELNTANAVHQSGVDRPSWLAGSFFPGVNINTQYTQVSQKAYIASYVGQSLANKYVTNNQFLARGHLAAKTDFIFATGQRSSFYFINSAPQWQPFNGGNWNNLEQNLRARIGRAGYNTIVYTGTYGVTQLRDQNNNLVDIYLYRDANNNEQVPVPLYYYKVVYEPNRKIGTAFVGINNPYYTQEEVKALTFCNDVCRNNSAFNWIGWKPDRIDIGYSFCCTIEEFRKAIPHLPEFVVNGILS